MAGLADNFLLNSLLRQPLLSAERKDSYDKLFASITVTPSKFDISSIAVVVVLRLVKSKAHHSPNPTVQCRRDLARVGTRTVRVVARLLWSQPTMTTPLTPRERDPHRRGSLVGKRI